MFYVHLRYLQIEESVRVEILRENFESYSKPKYMVSMMVNIPTCRPGIICIMTIQFSTPKMLLGLIVYGLEWTFL
jgi:hypothetical protein